MYHLMAQNRHVEEKEREKVVAANVAALVAATHQSQISIQGTATMTSSPYPPLSLSPTSMSPFFASQVSNDSIPDAAPAISLPHVTEIFSNDTTAGYQKAENLIMESEQESDESKQGLTTATRRHTLGPSGGQKCQLPKTSLTNFPLSAAAKYNYNLQDYRAILPQTNLTQYLPFVYNLPPETFSAKDPHLLKPPTVLGANFGTTSISRRASDGGAYMLQTSDDQPQSIAQAGEESFDNSQAAPGMTLPHQLDKSGLANVSEGNSNVSDSPSHSTLVPYVPMRGSTSTTATTNNTDSPRKRRTGLHTVMEKPPEICPVLLRELEAQMQHQSALVEQQHQHHLSVSSIPNTPSYSPIPNQTSPVSLPEGCSSPPITLKPPSGATIPAPTIISPMVSPSKPGSLRARRTGLSTVMEVGKQGSGKLVGKEVSSLLLPTERYSPVRRLSDGSPIFRAIQSPLTHSMPSSHDASPCCTDVRALQEEVLRLQNETQSGTSLDSAPSSGYMSPHTMANIQPCYLCSSSQGTVLNSSDMTGIFKMY